MWLFAIETMFMTIAEDFVSHNKTASPGQYNNNRSVPTFQYTDLCVNCAEVPGSTLRLEQPQPARRGKDCSC